MVGHKIDVRPILRGHLSTLTDNRFGAKLSLQDLAVFAGLPITLALGLIAVGFRFRVDAVNGFLNVFSILTGLLLNLLVLVLGLANTKASQQLDAKRRLRLIREMFANVCFAVLIAVIVVCTALCALSYMRSSAGATTGIGATILLSALTGNFVLTLLMILKRMYILLNKELVSEATDQPKAA